MPNDHAMRSMRDFMTLVEARGPKKVAPPASVDASALHGRLSNLISVLAGMNVPVTADWVQSAVEQMKADKHTLVRQAAEDQEQDPEGFNPASYVFDPVEAFDNAAGAIVRKQSHEHQILSDVATEERLYQDRRVKDPDDWSDMVEDSDVLRCLAAQRHLQGAVMSLDITKLASFAPMLEVVDRIVQSFHDAVGTDQAETPILVESVRQELGHLLPLMRFACTVRTTIAPQQ